MKTSFFGFNKPEAGGPAPSTKEVETLPVKTIVEEIHETFYSEVDRLLEEAKILKPLDTDKQALITKSARLQALGFTNTKEVIESSAEVFRLAKLEGENQSKELLVDTINYFNQHYPQYKFITEESVKKICEKYNLVYSIISNYVGTVPDANIEQMENFKIKEEDACYFKKTIYMGSRMMWGGRNEDPDDYISHYQFVKATTATKENTQKAFQQNRDYHESYGKSPLEICAPLKDFKKDLEVKDFKLSKREIPDPIVLQPVFYNGKKHYLIVTAWGPEAEDSLTLNENHN